MSEQAILSLFLEQFCTALVDMITETWNSILNFFRKLDPELDWKDFALAGGA